jgi:hypothetical protein
MPYSLISHTVKSSKCRVGIVIRLNKNFFQNLFNPHKARRHTVFVSSKDVKDGQLFFKTLLSIPTEEQSTKWFLHLLQKKIV